MSNAEVMIWEIKFKLSYAILINWVAVTCLGFHSSIAF